MTMKASIELHLRLYQSRATRDSSARDAEIASAIEELRLEAVAKDDQVLAKRAWCLANTLDCQRQFIESFRLMKVGKFYEAWCLLERIELAVESLRRHMKFDGDEFGLRFIERHTEQFQKLFPYGLFLSPAYIEKERRCSICDAVVSLRSGCSHELGEIYDGVKCVHKITWAELLEMSFVTAPVQKYSVPFMKDPKTGKQVDHYDYSMVSYVVTAVANPFHGWSIERTTKRHPHSRYRHLGRKTHLAHVRSLAANTKRAAFAKTVFSGRT
jgi:hypothetical protein